MCVSEEACILVNFQNLPFNLPSQQIDPCFYFLSLFFSFFLGEKKGLDVMKILRISPIKY